MTQHLPPGQRRIRIPTGPDETSTEAVAKARHLGPYAGRWTYRAPDRAAIELEADRIREHYQT